jgi:hypothetical protein
MRLATIRTTHGTGAVRLDPDAAVELGPADLGELLRRPGWRAEAAAADGPRHGLLLAYVSQIISLVPGDLIATGTPGGVGHARKPSRYLGEGTELITRIEGIGECRNLLVRR